MATASLVLGIIGVITSVSCVGSIFDILAIVFGVIALKKDDGSEGRAKAGKILGIIGLVICFLSIFVGIFAPQFIQATKH